MRAVNDEWYDDDGNDLREVPGGVQFGSSNSGTVVHALYPACGMASWSARCGQCTSRITVLKREAVASAVMDYEVDLCAKCADGGPSIQSLELHGAEVDTRDFGGGHVLRITDPELFAEKHCPPNPWK